jgi:hypothetical protein
MQAGEELAPGLMHLHGGLRIGFLPGCLRDFIQGQVGQSTHQLVNDRFDVNLSRIEKMNTPRGIAQQ